MDKDGVPPGADYGDVDVEMVDAETIDKSIGFQEPEDDEFMNDSMAEYESDLHSVPAASVPIATAKSKPVVKSKPVIKPKAKQPKKVKESIRGNIDEARQKIGGRVDHEDIEVSGTKRAGPTL